MRRYVPWTVLTVWLALAGAPANAHHSANAEFDTTKDVLITGVLVKLENVNPHSWWYVDVKAPDGKVTVVEARIQQPERADPPGPEGQERGEGRRHDDVSNRACLEGSGGRAPRVDEGADGEREGIRVDRTVASWR